MTELQRIARLLPGYDPFATAPEGWWFDEEAAQLCIDFIESNCRHVIEFEGLIKLEDWQKAFFANLFGWKRPDGTRRYKEALLMVARKNAKTTMAAMAILFVLYCDGVRGIEAYTAASEAEQSRIAFAIVSGMIEADADLSAHAELQKKNLTVAGGSYRALNSGARSKHGYNAHFVHIDESHAHKTPELMEAMVTGMGSRRQGLILHTTTSDFNRPNSICNDKHDYGSKVRDGIINDPAFLPVIYEATIDDDWTDPEVWRKANPNLGVSTFEEFLARECLIAQAQPSYQNTFMRLYCNIRTEQQTRFLQMDKWDKCGGKLPDLTNRECWGGGDLASRRDITALVLSFPDDGGYNLKPFFWIPADTARERGKADNVPYLDWIRDGWIKATNGIACDYNVIRHDINQLALKYDIREIAFDPWNALHLINDLREDDGWGDRIIQMPPIAKHLSSPMKDLEALTAMGKIRHGGNPVLRWMASNIVAKHDAYENLMPDKAHSTEKIDGIVAAVMGMGRASINAAGASVYDNPETASLFL